LKEKSSSPKNRRFQAFTAGNKVPSCSFSATSTENITVSFSSNQIHAKTAPNENARAVSCSHYASAASLTFVFSVPLRLCGKKIHENTNRKNRPPPRTHPRTIE